MVISPPGADCVPGQSHIHFPVCAVVKAYAPIPMEAEMKHIAFIILIAAAVAVVFLPNSSLPTYGEVTGSTSLVQQLTMLILGPVILTFERAIRLLGQFE